MKPSLLLGVMRPLDGRPEVAPAYLPAHHLVTHGCVLGMTGSGKTGLVTVLVEEAMRASVPVLVIDVKGDLPNLLLTFPSFDPAFVAPWIEASTHNPSDDQALAARLAEERRRGLAAFGIGEVELVDFCKRTQVRVITPGADAGELLHVLSALERRSSRWDTDVEGARAALSAAVSLILRLLGRDPDPARSREHVLISVLAERRLSGGQAADIGSLLPEIVDPPLTTIGALDVEGFMSKRARRDLAAALNTLLASPSFASWRQGETLDVAAWMKPVDGKTPATILSVAHLDDDERALVLGVVLEEVLTWVRSLPGTQRLKALIVFDEVYGFLPPHPASPPTKRPLVALMKQARAYGVGVLVATQNPMDLDYRALSNASLWCLGRLQTDADRERVLDGLANEAGKGESAGELSEVLKRLGPRWFVVRDAQSGGPSVLLQPRWAMSFLRGPMTRQEIRRARGR
ncbi:MAG: ATP-binding protein [Polyangiaceae bacterium]|nr:ATP-binding protein [Polyangiaceae bacterium]